jgi:hypothetical protein
MNECIKIRFDYALQWTSVGWEKQTKKWEKETTH